MDAKPLLVIVGETASGKSSLAIELARLYNGELICADSWSVYKEFNIGTAKPSLEDRNFIPHHLLDIADPSEGFSAAQFKDLAYRVIDEIISRGRLPIVVGGTGLYIDSVIYNYSFLPAGIKTERIKLDDKSLDDLLEIVKHNRLDTTGIDLNNKRRVIRLIENNGVRPTKSNLRQNTLVLGVEVARNTLEKRVSDRVEKMLGAGLEREVRSLSDKYGWNIEPMKGIGYREFKDLFSKQKDINEITTDIIRNTMKLAKKQRTWFKRNKDIVWIKDLSQANSLIEKWLKATDN